LENWRMLPTMAFPAGQKQAHKSQSGWIGWYLVLKHQSHHWHLGIQVQKTSQKFKRTGNCTQTVQV